jgi:hypothetical protein
MASAAKVRKSGGGRKLMQPKGNRRFVRRDAAGRFSEVDDAGRSIARDVRTRAKTKVSSGQGDRGDRARRKAR